MHSMCLRGSTTLSPQLRMGVLSFSGEGMLGTGRYSVSLGRGCGGQFYLSSKQFFPVSQQCAPRYHCLVVTVRGSLSITESSTLGSGPS